MYMCVYVCFEQDKNYTTYVGDNISFDDQRSPLQNNLEFKKALTVHEIQNDVTIYKIHRYSIPYQERKSECIMF